MNLDEVQKQVWENKIKKGFNTTDVCQEFCLLNGEVAEAFDAYSKKKDDLGLELADIAIYLLGLSQMLGFSLEDEINKKLKINEARQYERVNGVLLKKDDN
jgi:NTP pyrophosphatase (non-canonical NTP hydrolase)